MAERKRALLYARVSSSLQEKERTIESQVEELRKYAEERDYEILEECRDDGYSGATLERPGLDRIRDRLRDQTRAEEVDIVLFHSPDRLARKTGLQCLVLEELKDAGVRPEFLNYQVEDNPEGNMLLVMQGAFAEYERAKIIERNRRGKMHWARQGAYMGGWVPYGYRTSKDPENARRSIVVRDEGTCGVVKDMYRWLIEEQMSCRSIAKRLTDLGIPTRQGKSHCGPSVVNKILKSEAYKGVFYFHRAEAVETSNRRSAERYPKNKLTGRKIRPEEEWINIGVPAILDEATWEAAQEQLRQNSLHSPRNNTRRSYLLRSLIRCSKCGATYVGTFSHGRRRYRCNQHDALATKEGNRCTAPWVTADPIEEAVWSAITEALQQPEVLIEQHQLRVDQAQAPTEIQTQNREIESELKRASSHRDRIIDDYANQDIDLPEYKILMEKVKTRILRLERQIADYQETAAKQVADQKALTNVESFCETVSKGLDSLTFEEKQSLLRFLVERIVVEEGKVRVEAVIPLGGDTVDSVGLRPQSRNPYVASGLHEPSFCLRQAISAKVSWKWSIVMSSI